MWDNLKAYGEATDFLGNLSCSTKVAWRGELAYYDVCKIGYNTCKVLS